MWARVAGDVLDLATLSTALNSQGSDRTRVVAATAAVLGVTALDVFCGQQLSRTERERSSDGNGLAAQANDSGQVTKTLIINRPPDEVYRFWHDFEKLPTFMSNLESVQTTGEKRSHWKAKGPVGRTFEWDAEITDDQPNKRIAWRTVGESDVDHSGSVRFERATGGRGTLLIVELQYAPPGGALSAKIAKLFGSEPGQQIDHDLRILKQILETGEVMKSDASIHKGMHAAQPAGPAELSSSTAEAGQLVTA
jgi:uncharacterized membrane protein